MAVQEITQENTKVEETHHGNDHHDSDHSHEHHAPGYGMNIMIWLILISLTIITVAVAGIDLKEFTLFVALFIAGIKSLLVVNIFMHIKFEDLLFKAFLLLVTATLIVVFVLTSFDLFFRG